MHGSCSFLDFISTARLNIPPPRLIFPVFPSALPPSASHNSGRQINPRIFLDTIPKPRYPKELCIYTVCRLWDNYLRDFTEKGFHMRASTNSAKLFGGLILSGLFAASAIAGNTYNESISGDLSNSQATPTAFTLGLGTNAIIGSVNNTAGDGQDFIALTVPAGDVMTSYVNQAYNSSDNQGFTGFQIGSPFVGSPGAAASYAGYAHFGSGATNPSIPTTTVGVDLLPLMANSTVAAGATGFTAPLGPGSYTFLIQQLGGLTNYEFDINVNAAPEPATLAMLSLGGFGLLIPAVSRLRKKS